MDAEDERLAERAAESERAYKELLGPIQGATYTATDTATLDLAGGDGSLLGPGGAGTARLRSGERGARDRRGGSL